MMFLTLSHNIIISYYLQLRIKEIFVMFHILARGNEEIKTRKTVGSSLSSKDEFDSKKL